MTATQRPKLLCAADITHIPEVSALLEEYFDVEYSQATTQALQEHLPQVDAYFAALDVRLTADLLEKAPRLKAVTTPSTGTDHLDLKQIDAVACYTLDGPGSNGVDVETFSADMATVTIRGINIHPSIAKDRMVNALRVAADFIGRLPQEFSPETTDGRDGFLHPYEIGGGVGEVKLRVLLRDFDAARLDQQAQLLRGAARESMARFPGSKVEVSLARQYRNMAEGLSAEPRAVEYAQRALQRLGRTAKLTTIRGGTDGSRLTELGLPTPNLSTGQHNPHSAEEWACLEEMVEAAELLVSLSEVWGGK